MLTPWLPGEVWTLVFGHLSLSDRLRVRATCRHFLDLVDNGLWRDWTVELRRSSLEYGEHFWKLLRRWRVTSVQMSSPHSWTHVTTELPGLTALKTDIRGFTDLRGLSRFTNLERLHIIHHTVVDLDELSPVLPHRLRHLRVCQIFNINVNTLPARIPSDSSLKKLKSFAFHCETEHHPTDVLHFFLSSLPQLQHLSLSIYTDHSYQGHVPDLPPLLHCSLTSLELLGCKTEMFPMDFTKMLSRCPSLRSLAVFCCDFSENSEKLSSWLRELPALTSLVLECRDVGGFVGSIPSSVTRLILQTLKMDSEDMRALSERLPNLRLLHLEPYDQPLGPDVLLLPRLFPRLKTLCLSHKEVPEEAFLSLASLKELQVLETLDLEPPPADLVSKLRAQTKNRVQIYRRSETLWARSCSCSSDIPTDSWT